MEPTAFYLASGAAVAAGTLLKALRRLRGEALPPDFQKYKRVPIAIAAVGAVQRVCGKLEYVSDMPLVAPLSGRKCAYFEVTVQEFTYDSEGSPSWATRHVGCEMQDFFVEDGSGRARVHLVSPNVMLDIDEKFTPRFFKTRPTAVRQLLNELDSSVRIDDPECVCVREGVLEAGEEVTAVGLCSLEPDESPSIYRSSRSRLVVGPMRDGAMFVSDRKIRR